MFDSNDLAQIAGHGLTTVDVERQIGNFKNGFPFLKIIRAASPGDGVTILREAEILDAAEYYQSRSAERRIVKFVPASGAATRMFKELFEFVNDGKRGAGIDTLIENIEKFAFYPELKRHIYAAADDITVVKAIVGEGLCYGSQPKGLVTFHAYPDGARKAAEEHLVEGAMYASAGGRARVHLTVSPEHKADFERLMAEKVPVYEARYGVKYDISFSVQKLSTDTIAVCPDMTPFRNDDGSLLFRPAGHGALIENLNDIDADIIFVKNIDNVTTDMRRSDTIVYKKALAGLLLQLQADIFGHIRSIDKGNASSDAVAEFVSRELCVELPAEYDLAMLRRLLNRPLRLCGMVRNEGEPGGGPFWAANTDGTVTLQIAETSQISPTDMTLMRSSTHFNPVDLVCGVKNHRGEKFDLRCFTDPSTGFISSKSSGGRELLAQELPGLWNGAMADWNTIFIEVPATTFSPVKVVQDLLRPQHQ